MKKQKIKDKRLNDKAIEHYCQSVEDVLSKIYDRKGKKIVHLEEDIETEEKILAFQD